MIKNLVTHSGVFHADDLLAYTVLSDLYPEASLIRTRDTQKLEAAKDRGILFDTGGAYDPDNNIFDHHQEDPPTREDGQRYAAFGLVWKHFGKRWLAKKADIPTKHVDRVWKGIDDTLVRQVDTVDNGNIENYNSIETDITTLIFRANPSDIDMDGTYFPKSDSARDAAFKDTKRWVQPLLRDQAQSLGRQAISRDIVQTALDARETPGLVVLDTPVPWTSSIFECHGHKSARLVTFPTSGNNGKEWALQTVPTEPNGLTARQWFPKEWRGLRGEALEAKTGVQGAHFCHTVGFFCAADGREAAITLGKQTLKTWEKDKSQTR